MYDSGTNLLGNIQCCMYIANNHFQGILTRRDLVKEACHNHKGIIMSSFEENNSRNRPLWLYILLILAVVIGGYIGYERFASAKYDEAMEQAKAEIMAKPAVVNVFEVKAGDVPLVFEYAGRTSGSREVEIRARVSGILLKRSYIEGQAVKQGDVLFEIDPAPFQVALNQAQARFSQATNDWSRAQKLFKVQALSARERDQARSTFEQTRAEVENARINLGYTTVTAPISGVTSHEDMSEGSLVNADSSLLTRLTQLDPMYVNFSAPDSEVLDLRHMVATGEAQMPEDGILRAEVRLGNGSIYAYEGEVNFTDSIIDPQTGTVSNRAVMPNPENILMPGQFVRVVVKGISRVNAIAIPDRAILQGPQGPFVYVVSESGTAQMRPVKLGLVNNNLRLIENGLQQGDKVIIEGMIKVRPDAPVVLDDKQASPKQHEDHEDTVHQQHMLQAIDGEENGEENEGMTHGEMVDGETVDSASEMMGDEHVVDESVMDELVAEDPVTDEAAEDQPEQSEPHFNEDAASAESSEEDNEDNNTANRYVFGSGLDNSSADLNAEQTEASAEAQEE